MPLFTAIGYFLIAAAGFVGWYHHQKTGEYRAASWAITAGILALTSGVGLIVNQ